MNILIVDNDYFSQMKMRQLLEPYGECHLASDGREAVDKFLAALGLEERFGLICLDLMLPKLDGLSVLKQFRNYEKIKGVKELNRTKIITITSRNDNYTIMKAFEAPCDAYLIKPIEKRELQRQLAFLGIHKKLDNLMKGCKLAANF